MYGQTCTYNTPSAPPPPPPKPFPSSVAVFRVTFWKQLHVGDAWASVRTPEGGHAQSCTRSGAAWRRASAGCWRTGGMSSARCKCSWPRTSTMPPHVDRSRPGAGCGGTRSRTAPYGDRAQPPGPGSGGASRTTRRRPGIPPLPSRIFSALRKSLVGAGQHLCLRSLAGKSGRSGTLWSTLPYVQILDAPVPQLVDSTMDFFRLGPACCLHVLPVWFSGNRRWWNSWQTCLSSTLSTCSSGIPLTFQLCRLSLLVEVNKVFSLDRVRWPSKSLTFQPQVVDFLALYMVFPQDRASRSGTAAQIVDTLVLVFVYKVFLQIFIRQLSRRFCRMRLVKGFFALFPDTKKVRHDLRALGRTCLRTRARGRRQLVPCPWTVRRSRRGGGRRPSSKRLRLWRWLGCNWTRRARGGRGRRGGSGVFRSPRPTLRIAALVVVIRQWLVLLVFLPRAVLLSGPRCSSSRPVFSRRTVMLRGCSYFRVKVDLGC